MAFLFDLSKKFGQNPNYTVVNFDGKFIYLDGIIRLREITASLITASVKNAVIKIEGENLLIEEMDGDSVIVKGDIISVTSA